MSQIDSGDAARALSALRRKVQGTCAVCGKTFEGYTHQRYCGDICQQAAYRERHREELNRKRREKYQRQKGANANSAAEGRQMRQEGQQTAPAGHK